MEAKYIILTHKHHAPIHNCLLFLLIGTCYYLLVLKSLLPFIDVKKSKFGTHGLAASL